MRHTAGSWAIQRWAQIDAGCPRAEELDWRHRDLPPLGGLRNQPHYDVEDVSASL